jgi:carboxypeptidase Taq
MNENYKNYTSEMSKIADVGHSIAVLQWDKEVNLPKGSAAFRSQQIATLSSIAHELFTGKKFSDLLDKLTNDESLTELEKRNVYLTKKEHEKSTKFTTEFIVNKSKTISKCFQHWMEARDKNNSENYLASLTKLVDIVREEAEILGYEKHPYDALLDYYEPNLTVEKLDALFTPLKKELQIILKKIGSQAQVDNSILHKNYPKDTQWKFGLKVLENMGYDFNKGRQDISTHPFTTSFSSEDVRVTTRIDEQDLGNMTWSCIHEGGHALYEQGLSPENYGLPLGKYISLGIHESQSRLWENNVGRSRNYWSQMLPVLKSHFPDQLKNTNLEDFYKAINKVAPNLIRTEADELHYHLHVIIRYEIEKELMEKTLEVKDIKEAWNKKYKDYLNIDVPDDKNGFLQDVHWSHGSIGYFPTYSIGSLYAAQFFDKASKDIIGLHALIKQGDNTQLLDWLRKNIHQHGQQFDAEELCARITGEGLNAKYFIDYVNKKYKDIYDY